MLACTRRATSLGGNLIETVNQPLVGRFPNPGPMFPCRFSEAVIERQARDIEPEVGCALNVGVTAEYVGAYTGTPYIPGGQQRDAGSPYIGGTDAMLCLSHAPDQG